MDYKVDKAEKGETDEEDETDEDETIPEWVKVKKDKFDVIRSVVTRNAGDGLSTTVDIKKELH